MLRSESGNGTGLALLDGAFGSAEESFLGRENADELLHLAVLQVSNAGTQCVCVCVFDCVTGSVWVVGCVMMAVCGWMEIGNGHGCWHVCWCVFTCVLMDLTQRSEGARCSCSGQTDTEVWVLWDGIKLCVCGSLIATHSKLFFATMCVITIFRS